MAQNLQLLKRRIKTAGNIAQISKAMEMISASKIKKAQTTVLSHKPYDEKITNLTQSMIQSSESKAFRHPYIDKPKEKKSLYIIISPDKGLCGSLNTNLFKKVLESNIEKSDIVTVGKKAKQFCERIGLSIIDSFPMGTGLPNYKYVYNIVQIIDRLYQEGTNSVYLIFTRFDSVFSQEASVIELLPIQGSSGASENSYIFEPGRIELLKELLPYYLEVKLYNTFLEAHTSEQAARMIAMQNAKSNALDIADALTLSYNKSRQERITNEILSLGNNFN